MAATQNAYLSFDIMVFKNELLKLCVWFMETNH